MTDARGFELNVFGPFCAMWEPFLSGLNSKADQAGASQVKVRDAASGVLKSVVRAELEMMALASRRAQAYIHLPVELMTSRNPQDYYERALGFYQTAFEQYSQSSSKVMTILGDATTAVCSDVQKTRDYIDFSQVPSSTPEIARKDVDERPRHRRAA